MVVEISIGKKKFYYSYRIYYNSMDDAAIAFAKMANCLTISTHREYGAFIKTERIGGQDKYYVSSIFVGEHDNTVFDYLSRFTQPGIVAFVHTHPYCNGHLGGKDASFSWGDCATSMLSGYCYCSDVGSGNLFRIKSNFVGIFTNGVACDESMLVCSGLISTEAKYICRRAK